MDKEKEKTTGNNEINGRPDKKLEKERFISLRFPPRKDLLNFVEENLDKNVLKKLGKNPKRWLEELDIILYGINRDNLVCAIDMYLPPKEDKEFQRLGKDVFLYRGEKFGFRGLWLSKEKTRYDLQQKKYIPHTEWNYYKLATSSTLWIDVNFEKYADCFLPENFESKAQKISEGKRPIYTFEINDGEKNTTVYAKGAAILGKIYLTNPPSYRLTSFSRLEKLSSKAEMEKLEKMAKQKIKVPEIIGTYESLFEEYLFLKKVDGQYPNEYLKTHRQTIIKQDAEMLANLCLLGYRKQGFADFDDKIFNGENLYLIDVDEVVDIYSEYYFKGKEFRNILANPFNQKLLNKFRVFQKSLFKQSLRDALYEYRQSLAPSKEDKILYVKTFYKNIGWKEPRESEIKSLLKFPKNYFTFDRAMALASDTG